MAKTDYERTRRETETNQQRFIGYGRQSIDDSDLEAVCAALQSDFLTQGPAVVAFETALAEYVGAKYAVAVSNGSTALHLACLAGGLKAGDIGVTQPLTFVASANCMAYCGAEPHLVDIDPDTMTMNPVLLKIFLQKYPQCHTIIPVAYGGLSSHGAELRALAAQRIIIEDNCHAFGAKEADGSMVGACRYADMSVFSFHPVKPLTTGEGGAITTNSKALQESLLLLRSHGIVRGAGQVENTVEADNPWYYEQQELGFNYRLPDILAALGLSQLKRLDHFISRRRAIAHQYDEAFANLPHLKSVQNAPEQRARSGHHLYEVRIDFKALGLSRKKVMEALRGKNIGSQVHYVPVHKHPYYQKRLPQDERKFASADQFYEECLTLPCFPTLQNDDVERVINSIGALMRGQAGIK